MATTIQNITFDKIDKSIPEGKLLATAVCIICAIQFRDKKPDLVLQVIKDIMLYPLVNETFDQTMERIVNEHIKKNN